MTLADRIAVIDAGRVVQYGPPEDIFHRPASAFVAGFMGADNAIDIARMPDGSLSVDAAGGERLRAHFRSDVAWIEMDASASRDDSLRLAGTVTQAIYVGQGYRYRVRTNGADIWAHAEERMSEGAAVYVVVPRSALLVFSAATITRH